MKTIAISGVIGWDVSPNDIRKAIAEANGKEPLDIQISSPGGFVTDGLEIFNLIKAYPGPKTTHLMGLAASMASYIALAGDTVKAEANSVYMIHNVLGGAMGNHHDLRKAANIFEGFTALLAKAYAEKTKKDTKEIRAMMDAETWLFGAEAKEAGFIDEVIGAPTEEKAEAISVARAARALSDEIVRKFTDQDSLPKLAAMIQAPAAGVASSAAAATAAASQTKDTRMDINQLKAELPDLYTQAKEVGAKEERERREALVAFSGINADGDRAVQEAIASGKSAIDAMPHIQAAIEKGRSKNADGENAPAITTKPAATGSGAEGLTVEGLTAEDISALKKAGLSDDEIRANAPQERS
jgi:ATP-dependent Clp protease, protease subunit